MPLVVPGINSQDGSSNNTQSWMTKLMGKKISDSHTETSFAKGDLPKEHRVVGEGDMMTMDHKPDRLNIHTDKDGVVKKVTHG